jgi:hypothetical protein
MLGMHITEATTASSNEIAVEKSRNKYQKQNQIESTD